MLTHLSPSYKRDPAAVPPARSAANGDLCGGDHVSVFPRTNSRQAGIILRGKKVLRLYYEINLYFATHFNAAVFDSRALALFAFQPEIRTANLLIERGNAVPSCFNALTQRISELRAVSFALENPADSTHEHSAGLYAIARCRRLSNLACGGDWMYQVGRRARDSPLRADACARHSARRLRERTDTANASESDGEWGSSHSVTPPASAASLRARPCAAASGACPFDAASARARNAVQGKADFECTVHKARRPRRAQSKRHIESLCTPPTRPSAPQAAHAKSPADSRAFTRARHAVAVSPALSSVWALSIGVDRVHLLLSAISSLRPRARAPRSPRVDAHPAARKKMVLGEGVCVPISFNTSQRRMKGKDDGRTLRSILSGMSDEGGGGRGTHAAGTANLNSKRMDGGGGRVLN
ncbi:hypothetical protein FB451DRAFT_1398850 [Mycena latifolia]|nr:hypothetical protein FB451DRAFT_1398850 [Mycena latifolia]